MTPLFKLNQIWQKIPHSVRAKALENTMYPALKTRALSSTVQYLGFDFLAGFIPGTKRIERKRDWRLLKEFDRLSSLVLKSDAELFIKEILPVAALWATAPYFTPRELIDFLKDGLEVYRRRNDREHKDLPQDADKFPEYYQRNFHFQSDGYFSVDSAARYDRQVDLLFGGTADAMRRLWVKPLLEIAPFEEARLIQGENLKILEIGSGAGSATLSILGLFPECDYTGLDLSSSYLDFAQKRFSDQKLLSLGRKSLNSLKLIPANAEAMPVHSQSMDLVISVFMFHELPLAARKNVIGEVIRVLRPGGRFIFVDAAQAGDSDVVDEVLPTFPQNYHEPFFTDYTKNPMEELLEAHGFIVEKSGVGLVSKFVIAQKQ